MPRSLLEMKRRYSPIRSFECNRCSEPAEHRHHRDRDRSNTADSNIELLCGACHAEEHDKRKKRAHSKATKTRVRSGFKVRAEALRVQGYSYNEIAAELDCTWDQAWSYVNG